jgi:hypothetical protein
MVAAIESVTDGGRGDEHDVLRCERLWFGTRRADGENSFGMYRRPRCRSPPSTRRANSDMYRARNPSFASFRSSSNTAASRSRVGKVNESPSHGSPNIRHRFATIDLVFHQE